MKSKNLIVFTLILTTLAAALFATNPTESFVVETQVLGKHGLKLAAVTGFNAPTTVSAFNGITADTSKFIVNDNNYNAQQTVRKLVAYCNSVSGYDIALSALAMKSAAATPTYIKFTVTAGDATVTTTGDGVETVAANKVIDKTSLSNIDFYDTDVKITVNATDYENAVTGTYSGTIKFELTSH